MLVFENHGPEVGATIAHPHGQIFAFRRGAAGAGAESSTDGPMGRPLLEDDPAGDRVVADAGGWRAWVPHAATTRTAAASPPSTSSRPARRSTTPSGDVAAVMLVDVLGRLDRLFDAPDALHVVDPPAPDRRRRLAPAWLHLEIAAPWRADGVLALRGRGRAGQRVFYQPGAPRRGRRAAERACDGR